MKPYLTLLTLLSIALITSCKIDLNSKDSSATIEADESVKETLDDLFDSDEDPMEAVDYQELKRWLPESLVGMRRTELSGQKAGMLGIQYSVAQAEYEEGDRRADITIMDIAKAGRLAKVLASWSELDYEKESDEGYERIGEIDGNKALISYNKKRRSGKRSIIIADRFIVDIEARNIEDDDIDNILDKLNFNRRIRKL